MKEHPIIFSTESVKAILNGTKTMTRRVIKPQPLPTAQPCTCQGIKHFYTAKEPQPIDKCEPTHNVLTIKCPYGQVGDRLWVREKHYPYYSTADKKWLCIYYADNPYEAVWKPSLFMPRWASRITLEITGVRVERVQDISVEDCIAEGIKKHISTFAGMSEERNPIYSYELLWDSLNAKRGYGWEVNPFVWVISFKGIGEEK